MKVKFKNKAFIRTDGWSRGGRDERVFSGRRVRPGEVLDLPEAAREYLPKTVEFLDDPEPKAAPKPKAPVKKEKPEEE